MMARPGIILSFFFSAFLLFNCSGSKESASSEAEEQEKEKKVQKLQDRDPQEVKIEKRDYQTAQPDTSSKGKKEGKNGSLKKAGGDEELFARHERTRCYGRCPVYILTIRDDRTARLKVEAFMELDKGEYQGKVEKTDMKEIRELADSIGFFDLKKEYDDPKVTDLPSRITRLSFEEKEHRVRNRHGGPEGLDELEKLFARIVEDTEWNPAPSNDR